MEIYKGDLVDFGVYGKLYVCNTNFSEKYFWVTDDESDRYNEYASGWSISKNLAKSVIERYEDLDESIMFNTNNRSKFIKDNTESEFNESFYDSDLLYDYSNIDDDFTDEEMTNILGGELLYCPDCGSDRYYDGHCYACGTLDEDVNYTAKKAYYWEVGVEDVDNELDRDVPFYEIPYKTVDENVGECKTFDEALNYVNKYILDGIDGTYGIIIEVDVDDEEYNSIVSGMSDMYDYNVMQYGKLKYSAYKKDSDLVIMHNEPISLEKDILESVTPEYFTQNYSDIYKKYLSAYGEGDNMASQAVTATNKLIQKWYNDGDVFDNTYYLSGWVNDISSYANWLYNNIPETNAILDTISTAYSNGEYEDLLRELCYVVYNEEFLSKLSTKEKIGSIYNTDGKFNFVIMDDDYETDDLDESFKDCDLNFDLFEEYLFEEESDEDHIADRIINLGMGLDCFDYYNSQINGIDDILYQLKYDKEDLIDWLLGLTEFGGNEDEIKSIISDINRLDTQNLDYINENLTVSDLQQELKDAMTDILMSDEFGFDEYDIDDYTRISITQDNDFIYIEIGAELSYNGMRRLSEKLDEIIAKYDKYAYFDDIDAGLIGAIVRK